MQGSQTSRARVTALPGPRLIPDNRRRLRARQSHRRAQPLPEITTDGGPGFTMEPHARPDARPRARPVHRRWSSGSASDARLRMPLKHISACSHCHLRPAMTSSPRVVDAESDVRSITALRGHRRPSSIVLPPDPAIGKSTDSHFQRRSHPANETPLDPRRKFETARNANGPVGDPAVRRSKARIRESRLESRATVHPRSPWVSGGQSA